MTRGKTLLGAVCLAATVGRAAVPGSFGELTDLRSACRAKAWRTFQASGYDRGGGYYDSGNFVRIEPGPRYILLDTEGPGCIDRMWFTRKTEKEPYDLLLYLNDEEKPAIRIDLDKLTSGSRPPFIRPLVGTVDKARYSYVPVGFRRSCKAVLVPTAPLENYQRRVNSAGTKIPHIYYQITYRRLPKDTPVHPFTWKLDRTEQAALAAAADLWKNAGRWPWGTITGLQESLIADVPTPREPPHKTTEVCTLEGPGCIYGLRVGIREEKSLRLRITWDDDPTPAVDVPLDILCASPEGADVSGLWLGVDKGVYNVWLPMPFRRRAHITLEGDTTGVYVLLRWRREQLHESDLPFCATAYDHTAPAPGKDYVVLDTRGRGHFVGVIMDRPGNMEGDDRFYVDGETVPSIHGTGTEDFFSFAWGFSHRASLPLHGITRQAGRPICYRVHLPAGVPFSKSLLVSWEHGSGNKHQGRYSGVVVYYNAPPPPAGDSPNADQK